MGACGGSRSDGNAARRSAVTTPTFVQIAYLDPPTPQTSVAVSLGSAQAAGNLNVVAVGWNNATANISSVTDTRGNTYQLAIGPTRRSGQSSQSIYYAKNIAAGANTVTVAFTASVPYPSVRVAEYSGLDLTNPLDVTVAATGSGATANSGAVTTTNANDLLVAADYIGAYTTAAGSGFTVRVITAQDSALLADRLVTAVGSYSATASLTGSDWWIMQMVAFKAAPSTPDTMPPTAPSNLTATAVSSTAINLAWTAATDDVGVAQYRIERCAGTGCADFAQFTTTTGTTFADSGLASGIGYSYRVRAADAAGNLGPYSGTASATTPAPDTQPPTAPADLTATAASSSQINLAWTAATDNISVSSYLIERCQGAGCSTFAQIGSVTGGTTTFSNTSLAPSTSYSYRVRATDGAGNTGAYSNTASATTASAPVNPIAYVQSASAGPAGSQSSLSVTFASAQTGGNLNVVIVGWNNATSTVTGVTDTRGNSYQLAIGPTRRSGQASQSIYYAKNIAAGANNVTVAFSGAVPYPDVRVAEYRGIDPTSPLDVTVAATGTGATANSGAVTTTSPSGLLVAGTYVGQYTLAAGSGFTQRIITPTASALLADRIVSAAGSYSATASLTGSDWWIMSMAAFRAAPSGPDTQAPTAPTNLTATAPNSMRINLLWAAATDNVGVTGYQVERCQGAGCSDFAMIATAASTSYNNTGLTAGTSYSYRLRATDAAGNLGPYSATVSATTPVPDVEAPTAPATLTATAGVAGQISLAWAAATDNVGITGYQIESCQGVGCTGFAQIAVTTSTTYINNGLQASTSYSYRVRATDAAANIGPYSPTASATTIAAPANATYAQGNYVCPTMPQTSVTVAYNFAPQTVGNLNVVIVGWNNATSNITSVTDTRGNTYQLAIGPTRVPNQSSQAIYYAKNILGATAGGNTVTVTFSAATPFPDVRIAEYGGIDPVNPLDVTVGTTGSGPTANSGSVTTTNTNDLLVAGTYVGALTQAAGSGFTQRAITVPDGSIIQDRMVTSLGSYNATATLSGNDWWIMQMAAFRVIGSAPPETTPPAVSITSPGAGATVSGTVTVNVTATDQSGVGGVALLVDGLPMGAHDSASPYAFTFNSARFANGAHNISAYAWDSVSNVGTAAPVSVTFNNASPADPTQVGVWSGTLPLPLVSIDAALLPNGKVLMWDGQSFGFDARVWDPVLNRFDARTSPVNIFCSGHENLADGRVIIVGGHAGGHIGITAAVAFDPLALTWSVLPDMTYPRWYPTANTLGDGRVLVLSGESNCQGCYVSVPEIYNPATNAWTRLTSAPFTFTFYPHIFQLPDGKVLVSSTVESPTASQILDLNALTWTAVGGPAVEGSSAVMYEPGKVLKTGKAWEPDRPVTPTTGASFVLDLTGGGPPPNWRQVTSMTFPRIFHTLTSLPDGTVLVTGGGPTTAATATAAATLAGEIWSPSTETWSVTAPMTAPRLYHSEALLMPDARVMVLGGGRFNDNTQPTDQFSAEFYSPPYLFKGPRPVITSAPASVSYGGSFAIQTPQAAQIAKVSLIRFGSVTHAVNMGQRFLPLAFTASAGTLNVTAPVNANLATPGNYLLFIVDTNGVPSVAATVRL